MTETIELNATRAVERDAYAVLLPAFDTAYFGDDSFRFFLNGGVASLLGSSRPEYLARRMTAERAARETPALVSNYAIMAQKLAGHVLIAVDHEIGGVHRLHKLAPQLPHPSAALQMSEPEIEGFGHNSALAALKVGVNFFLSPVVDVVTGPNPWLQNRPLSEDPKTVSRVASAFVRGVQFAGVAATAKHFPGHHVASEDPFESATVVVPGTLDDLTPGFMPFRALIRAGVKAVMMGPIPVLAIDPNEPSSTSPIAVRMLREQFEFTGLIVSDDLDLPGTLRGREVADVAVASLLAGVELLLLASGPQIDQVAQRIVTAAKTGELPRATLAAAAAKVRRLAEEATQHSQLPTSTRPHQHDLKEE